MTGLTPEYENMINYFDTDYEFMSWYGYIADYLHAFQILSAVEISNDGSLYKPLEAKLNDVSKLSIADTYIETTLEILKESVYADIQLGCSKHHDNECIINAFTDHYEYTVMKDNKRNILARETIIIMMGNKEKYLIKQGATIKDLNPIFIKYRLNARNFDAFTTRLVYKSDYTSPDFHAQPLCCMI